MRDVKYSLLRAWPLKWPRARTNDDIRLIVMGRELRDDETVAALAGKISTDPIALHLSVRERAPSSPATPTVRYPSSPVQPPPNTPSSPACAGSGDAANASVGDAEQQHFHAVTVSEREFCEFRQIFDSKKGPDGRIACATVRMVLRSYWRFIHREGFQEATPESVVFPEHRLEQLCRKLGITEQGMTLDQFLTVFYLFDNAASEQPCIHGDRERVRMATAQLHAVLQPSHDFYHERFEEICALVSSDENGRLTCKEMELLFYMYSVHVMDKVKEEELVAKVQAIVRMRIQSSKYNQLVDAARTVQCAWRMRMFAADRSNHDRIAQFLRTMMQASSPGKVGGPRHF